MFNFVSAKTYNKLIFEIIILKHIQNKNYQNEYVLKRGFVSKDKYILAKKLLAIHNNKLNKLDTKKKVFFI